MRALLLVSLAIAAGVTAFAAAPSTAPAVQKLIDQLGDDDADVRDAAARKLEGLGEDALATLRRAAKSHPDADVRLRARVVAAAIEKKLYGEVRQYKASGWVCRCAVTPDG